MVIITRLGNGVAFERDVTLTEQGVVEINCYARGVRKIHILSRGRSQFTSDVDCDT